MMMRIVKLLSLMLTCGVALGQPAERVRSIGYLAPGTEASVTSFEPLRSGLRELGWIEGRNLKIEFRFASGRAERLRELASELVRLNVDVIVASSTPSVQATREVTSTIPIVMGSAADAEGSGFVASLGRPGGNITGITLALPMLSGKQLELLKEVIPSLSRVAYLAYRPDPAHKLFVARTQEAAARLKIHVEPAIVAGATELPAAFEAMRKHKVQAVIVQPLFANNLGLAPQVVSLAQAQHLSTISVGVGLVEAGGLLYYGPDPAATFARIAGYVDRILRGGKPAEMPVEQPQQYELAVNLAAAKKLGVRVPRSLVVRANRVIE